MSVMPASKVVVVTGGSSGIGRAIALALARRGYAVGIVGTTQSRVTDTVAALQAHSGSNDPTHLGMVLSVTAEADMAEMARRTVATLGPIDVLITSAGIGRKSDSQRRFPHPAHALPLSEWQEVLDVNLTGAFLASRAVLPAMLGRGQGHIINIGSSTTPRGLRGTAFAPAYCASKFALVGLTESLAEEVGPAGVKAQVIFPGPVDTPLVSDLQLARPFGGSVSAENFADATVDLLELDANTHVIHPHILPFKSRRD